MKIIKLLFVITVISTCFSTHIEKAQSAFLDGFEEIKIDNSRPPDKDTLTFPEKKEQAEKIALEEAKKKLDKLRLEKKEKAKRLNIIIAKGKIKKFRGMVLNYLSDKDNKKNKGVLFQAEGYKEQKPKKLPDKEVVEKKTEVDTVQPTSQSREFEKIELEEKGIVKKVESPVEKGFFNKNLSILETGMIILHYVKAKKFYLEGNYLRGKEEAEKILEIDQNNQNAIILLEKIGSYTP